MDPPDLDNDTELRPGALTAMTKALEEDAATAAVGPKLVYPHDQLQEAGLIGQRLFQLDAVDLGPET